MTDHHAEYEAAARRKSADAMVADVRELRDEEQGALDTAMDKARAWHDDADIDALQHIAVVRALDGLLRKWGQA